MTGPEEGPLPPASDIIQSLDKMLKGGGRLFGESGSTPSEPVKEPAPFRKGEEFYMATFLMNYFPQIPTGHPRDEAKKLFDDFPSIRNGLIENLKQSSKAQEAEIIRGISLNNLADFAKGRHEEFARASGREEIGSPRLQDLRFKAEYWLRVEQISRGAAELEIK